MLRHRFLVPGAALGAAFLLQGCLGSDSNPAGADDDTDAREGIENVIFEEQADLADPDVRWFDDSDPAGAAAAPIATHVWRRQLLTLDRSVDISITKPDGEPATAEVVARAEATGILHLWACSESELAHYEKDFEDGAVRSMLFRRTRRTDASHHGWQLVALSGVAIRSPETTRAIASVRVRSGDVDETITNVTELVRVGEILALPWEAEVEVTVDTGDSSDQVYLHLRHHHRRLQLESNGDGTFTGRFLTGGRPGPRHFVVDVLSEGTLLDDVAPYDNVAWGIPYRIERPDLGSGE